MPIRENRKLCRISTSCEATRGREGCRGGEDCNPLDVLDREPTISIKVPRLLSVCRQTGNEIAYVLINSSAKQLMQTLVTVDWPETARPHVKFEIESDETVKERAGVTGMLTTNRFVSSVMHKLGGTM